jgi:hypothetical protein
MKGGLQMLRVTSLNPLAAGDAVMSASTAPADGFFTPAPYRGAFSTYGNWLAGWTAVDAFGMVSAPESSASHWSAYQGDWRK